MTDEITYFGLTVKLIYSKIPISTNDTDYFCKSDEFYLEIEDIAKYYVDAKNTTIYIEQHPTLKDPFMLQTWLYGTVFAYLLQYNQYLVLHGSSVLVNGHAVIFSGDSGMGKSTLAAKFVSRGYPLLTDDVVAIRVFNNTDMLMYPGRDFVKLHQSALEHFGKSSANLKEVFYKEDKFEFPIELHSTSPVAIKKFYQLSKFEECESISITKLDHFEKMNILIDNTYRYGMLQDLKDGLKIHLRQISLLANKIDVYSIIRPEKTYLLNELADIIEATF